MARSKWNHDVHKYMKVVFISRRTNNETVIWRCTLPNCQHYLVGEMVLGKLCVCNRCEDEVFEMERAHLSKKRPHCIACTKVYKTKNTGRPQKPSIAAIAANLDDLLKVE